MHREDEHLCGSGRTTLARARHIPVIGVGGPVGSGKTALVEALCRRLRDHVSLAVVTNDIFTKEDAEFLIRRSAPPSDDLLRRACVLLQLVVHDDLTHVDVAV